MDQETRKALAQLTATVERGFAAVADDISKLDQRMTTKHDIAELRTDIAKLDTRIARLDERIRLSCQHYRD